MISKPETHLMGVNGRCPSLDDSISDHPKNRGGRTRTTHLKRGASVRLYDPGKAQLIRIGAKSNLNNEVYPMK